MSQQQGIYQQGMYQQGALPPPRSSAARANHPVANPATWIL